MADKHIELSSDSLLCAHCDIPAIAELDGDNLCQSHADAWVRAERPEAA